MQKAGSLTVSQLDLAEYPGINIGFAAMPGYLESQSALVTWYYWT